MEDYLESKLEQKTECENMSEESSQKAEKDKTSAKTMRNMAMQCLSGTRRCSEDRLQKKRRSNGNDTMRYLEAKAGSD